MSATTAEQATGVTPEMLHACLDSLGTDDGFEDHIAALQAGIAQERLDPNSVVPDLLLGAFRDNHDALCNNRPWDEVEILAGDLENALATFVNVVNQRRGVSQPKLLGAFSARISPVTAGRAAAVAALAASSGLAGCGVTSTEGALGEIATVGAEKCYDQAGRDRVARAACDALYRNGRRVAEREARQASRRDEQREDHREENADVRHRRSIELSEADHQKALELRESYDGEDLRRLYNQCRSVVDELNRQARQEGRQPTASIQNLSIRDMDRRRNHACRVVAEAHQQENGARQR